MSESEFTGGETATGEGSSEGPSESPTPIDASVSAGTPGEESPAAAVSDAAVSDAAGSGAAGSDVAGTAAEDFGESSPIQPERGQSDAGGSPGGGWTREPAGPLTLAIDVGGTGIKASVLDSEDRMVADRVRVDTTYPLSPDDFVERVAELVRPLPVTDRVAVGFPGVVRRGRVLTAPHFVTAHGPGSAIVPDLLAAWTDFPVADRLAQRLGRPTRVANDADLQGLAVVSGHGLEFVVTLGTGVGTALFLDGVLAPHLELAHHPFRKGESYNEQIGDAALKRIGPKKWRRRTVVALENFSQLVNFDRCYVGGGNARLLQGKIDPSYVVVDNVAGILGGIRLWERHGNL